MEKGSTDICYIDSLTGALGIFIVQERYLVVIELYEYFPNMLLF